MTYSKIATVRSCLLITGLFVFMACSSDDAQDRGIENEGIPPEPTAAVSPNILFIISDDMGLDATNGYSEGTLKPNTPQLDSIMNAGLRFTNIWVNPTCSPTRASIITGKYGVETGVLSPGDALNPQHTTLQAYINHETDNSYATAVVGKWHLAENTSFNPESLGIDYYAGLLSGGSNSFTSWNLTQDGVTTTESSYITEKFTDLAIDWVGDQEKPWFLWLAYTAPHTPFHLPPNEMHSQGALPTDAASINANPLPYYLAAIEAMDFQISRLLDAMDTETLANTVLVFLGDNGTPSKVVQAPYVRRKAKGSLYQGGVQVPLFVSGPTVTRTGTEDALLNGTDLFATIASMAGVSVETIYDSKNFKSLLETATPNFREYVYSEVKDEQSGTEGWCIRNAEYKLIEYVNGDQELYDMLLDPYETTNLLAGTPTSEANAALQTLEGAVVGIRQ